MLPYNNIVRLHLLTSVLYTFRVKILALCYKENWTQNGQDWQPPWDFALFGSLKHRQMFLDQFSCNRRQTARMLYNQKYCLNNPCVYSTIYTGDSKTENYSFVIQYTCFFYKKPYIFDLRLKFLKDFEAHSSLNCFWFLKSFFF